MLRGVRALVDFFSDHLAQPGLFCKPLARRASYGMPAQLDGTGLQADVDLTRRDHAWSLAKSQLVLQGELRLEHIVLAEVRSAVVYMCLFNVKGGCGLGWVVRAELRGGKGCVVLQEVS